MLILAALGVAAFSLAIPVPPQLDICFSGPFRGITATDETGATIGEPDRNDWTCPPAASLTSALPETRRGRTAAEVPPIGPPTEVCLAPASPNPATSATRLQFALPRNAAVQLVIYGQDFRHGPFRVFPVRALVEGPRMTGLHTVVWDLRDDHGARVPRGIYRVVLRVEDQTHCGDIEVP